MNRQEPILSRCLRPRSLLRNLPNLELEPLGWTFLRFADSILGASSYFLRPERQSRSARRFWLAGLGLLLRIGLEPFSVLLALVQTEIEFSVKDMDRLRTAPETSPKVAAGGSSSLRARHPRLLSCGQHLATAKWTVLLVGFEGEIQTVKLWVGSLALQTE